MITALSAEDCFRPRFDGCRPLVEQAIATWLKDIAERRFMADTQSRPIIRTFCSLAGVPEVRAAAVSKSDNWLSVSVLYLSLIVHYWLPLDTCLVAGILDWSNGTRGY